MNARELLALALGLLAGVALVTVVVTATASRPPTWSGFGCWEDEYAAVDITGRRYCVHVDNPNQRLAPDQP